MTWVRIDDIAPLHPKHLRAGPEACWLWVAGLAYANRHVTDGHLPPEALTALYPSDEWPRSRLTKLAAKLVEVRLWEIRAGGGWFIRGYEEYQREAMREAVEERREWERQRKSEQRKRRKPRASGDVSQWDRGGTGVGQVRGTSVGHVPPPSEAPQGGMSQVVSQAPVPSRPVPSKKNQSARGRDPDPEPRKPDPPRLTPEQVAKARPAFVTRKPEVTDVQK